MKPSADKPNFYRQLAARHPRVFEALDQLGAAVRDGPLDERTVQLVQLGAAAAARSEGAVHSHTRRALAAGVSADEVRHALVALVSTVGLPTVTAALSWAEDELGGTPGA
jgi:4-carboxymuconolactone decarboxylase